MKTIPAVLPVLILIGLIFCSDKELKAQFSSVVDCPDSTFCIPSVIGMPRSKAFILDYEYVWRHRVESVSILDGDGLTELQNEHRYGLDIRFPIYNKDHLKFALGFAYTNEDFIFSDGESSDYPLYRTLNDRNLKSTGIRLYMVRSWRGQNYFIVRASLDLNGDYSGGVIPENNYVKFSVAPMFGYKKNERVSMGGGLAWGYEFGQANIFPFFVYNNTFNSWLGLEMVLPASIQTRFTFSPKDIAYVGVKLSGASFTMNTLEEGPLSDLGTVQLQTSEVKLMANYEREIYDFLWFRTEAGVRFNYKFDLTTEEQFRPDILVESSRKPAFYLRTGIFLVPPRKFLQ